MIDILYPSLLLLLSPVVFVAYAIRHGWGRATSGWRERWALEISQTPAGFEGKRLWFHAASLGELEAVRVVLQTFKQRHPDWFLHLTTLTPEAKKAAMRDHLADTVSLAPLDLFFLVRRWINHVKPKALILVETELWPGLIHETSRAGIKTILINGRLSERSLRHWTYLKPWVKQLLQPIRPLLTRTDLDRQRFIALGASPETTFTTGNLKLVRAARRELPPRETLRNKLGLESKHTPVIVAGSTWPGEEETIARSVQTLRSRWPHLTLIVAPRRLERVPEIEKVLESHHFKTRRRSLTSTGDFDALILDTLGELADVYGLADIAIVGRSLVPGGGQNPIEPAAWGIPVFFGPSMENFRDVADDLIKTGGGRQVSPESLSNELKTFLSDDSLRRQTGEAARKFIESQTQALEKTLHVIETSLAR